MPQRSPLLRLVPPPKLEGRRSLVHLSRPLPCRSRAVSAAPSRAMCAASARLEEEDDGKRKNERERESSRAHLWVR
uniref:Uncharacterized protein n=1 Tax=Oryza rufipogon TaxID=4529 RepID=A0A0E0NS79_ORYRU